MSVYLEVDGKPVPISDCVWAGIAPCGCIDSALRAREDVLTAEQARLYWAGGRKREAAKDPNEYVLHTQETFPWEQFKQGPHDRATCRDHT